MNYVVDVNAEEPIMLVNKHIGYDDEDGMGIDGSLFQAELLQLDNMGKKRIQVWINSPGGTVADVYNMISAVLKSNTPVDTYNVGMAASSAGLLFMSGRKRVMADYALFMTHPPSAPNGQITKAVEAISGSIVSLIAAKSNFSEAQVNYLMQRTTWMNAKECLDNGIATEIEETRTTNQKYMPVTNSMKDVKEAWAGFNSIVNNAIHNNFKQHKTVNMTKVTMKLGLNEAATEDNIIEAIKVIENRAYTAETKVVQLETSHARELDEIKNKHKAEIDNVKAEAAQAKTEAATAADELAGVKNKLTSAETELKTVKDKLEGIEAERNAAVLAEKETKAKALIDAHVKTGRIKNDAKIIERYVNMAKDDFDGTKELIESMPLSVKSPVVITEVPGLAGKEVATSATALAVRNKLRREGKI